MPLMTGTSLGQYQVLAPLGAGGMGEVYRARDTTLGRDVALKILPSADASDPRTCMEIETNTAASDFAMAYPTPPCNYRPNV